MYIEMYTNVFVDWPRRGIVVAFAVRTFAVNIPDDNETPRAKFLVVGLTD
jgi:hypothetical protein